MAYRFANGSISLSKAKKIKRKRSASINIAGKRKKRTGAKIKAKTEICEGKVIIDLPIQTKSEANCFEHWRFKYERHKKQQRQVALALNPLRDRIKLPCVIKLIRFAPDELDRFDNLPMSFKYIVDAICAIITGELRPGKADSDPRITIACNQVKSKEYGIRIEITNLCEVKDADASS
jgi:hypothetical protein